MQLPFVKMHGLGNDFVVLDRWLTDVELEPALIQRIADRRLGVGCDQVLSVGPPTRTEVLADYRVYNADGSAAEHCGNGLRCVGLYLKDRHAVGPDLALTLGESIVHAELLADGRVRAEVGVPEFDPAAVDLIDADADGTGRVQWRFEDQAVAFQPVSVGNPHAVIVVEDAAAAPVARIGPALQAAGLFGHGVNVGFLEVVSVNEVRLRVYERGAGETLACGSGACAAVAAGVRAGLLDRSVTVALRGGMLDVEWPADDQPVWITGPATFVFEGTMEL